MSRSSSTCVVVTTTMLVEHLNGDPPWRTLMLLRFLERASCSACLEGLTGRVYGTDCFAVKQPSQGTTAAIRLMRWRAQNRDHFAPQDRLLKG